MRWKTKQDPKLGDTRWVKKFAWFPVETASGDSLWMESYYVEEVCENLLCGTKEEGYCWHNKWVTQQTVTPEEYRVIHNNELKQYWNERNNPVEGYQDGFRARK